VMAKYSIQSAKARVFMFIRSKKRFLMFLGALTVQGLPIVIPFLPVLMSRLIHALDAAVAHESGDEPKSHQHRERTATLA
jgi:hypothetical protein